MKRSPSVFLALAAIAVLSSFSALFLQNRYLRTKLVAAQKELMSRPPSALRTGDSAADILVTQDDSMTVALGKLVGERSIRILYFYKVGCRPCLEQLPAWADYHSQYGAEGVMFVDCSSPKERQMYPDLGPNKHFQSCQLAPEEIGARKIRTVPQVLLVDNDGSITQAYASVDALILSEVKSGRPVLRPQSAHD